MQTIDYLFTAGNAGYFWPGVLTALLIALLGGGISWLVVIKRLSFIGQGVSHAAFGGVGLALVLGLTSATTAAGLGSLAIILAFSLFAALGISFLSGDREEAADTAIGIVLSIAMAIGFLLHYVAQSKSAAAGRAAPPSLEQILFGSITTIRLADLSIALVAAALVLGTLSLRRHHVLFWMFDEQAAPAFGVDTARTRLLVMALLAIVVVITMKLAGVVLATAVLVLPGAIAMRLTQRLARVIILSIISALAATVAGVIAAFELDIQPGPAIVLALGILYIAASLPAWLARLQSRSAPASQEPA